MKFRNSKFPSGRLSEKKNTSWNHEAKWYNKITDHEGHYYHQHVVIPGTLKLLNLQQNSSLLDLACGQGVLEKQVLPGIEYMGIDSALSLITFAKREAKSVKHTFLTADLIGNINIKKKDYTHGAIILALQNIKDPEAVLKFASTHLIKNGILVIVLNHPCFRIPRQSSWGIDEQNKLQYRRVNRYLSPLEIPINMHPGARDTSVTWTYHQPVSYYAGILKNSGFVIETIQEWTSDKISEGKAARMENRGRSEIPLFMAIKAVKRN